MIADQKDFITPHITDSHTLDYPCFHSGFVCEYELPHWSPIHIGGFVKIIGDGAQAGQT